MAFVDMGGHDYAVVRASAEVFETEFVSIPRPLERSKTPHGGSLRYRVLHGAPPWQPGTPPVMEQRVLERDVGLSV